MITIYCHCGEIYHAEERHEGKNIKCGKCGNVLLIKKLDTPPSVQRTREPLQAKEGAAPTGLRGGPGPPDKGWWQEHLYSIIGVAAIACILAIPIILVSYSENRQKLHPAITPPSVEPVNPKRLPHGSEPFGPGIRSGHSSLTVDNGTDGDAVLKVIRGKDKIQLIRSFYVHQGKKLTAFKIPPGNYVLRIAFGKDWDSQNRKFNFGRRFMESESFEIMETTSVRQTADGQQTETQFNNMSITLHKVLQGNFRTHGISEEVFNYP